MEMEPERLRKQKHTFQRIRQKKREFFAIWFGGNSTYLHIWDPQKNSNIIPTREHIDAYPQIFILINTSSFGPLNLIWWKQQHLRAKKKKHATFEVNVWKIFWNFHKKLPKQKQIREPNLSKSFIYKCLVVWEFSGGIYLNPFYLTQKKTKNGKTKTE